MTYNSLANSDLSSRIKISLEIMRCIKDALNKPKESIAISEHYSAIERVVTSEGIYLLHSIARHGSCYPMKNYTKLMLDHLLDIGLIKRPSIFKRLFRFSKTEHVYELTSLGKEIYQWDVLLNQPSIEKNPDYISSNVY